MRRPTIILAFFSIMTAYGATPDGEALYKQRCSSCHDGKPQPRMPSRQELTARTPESIYQAMFGGAMAIQAWGLTSEEGRAITRYITAKKFASPATIAAAGKCAMAPGAISIGDADWNGWSSDLVNSRYQPHPGMTAADVPKLKLKWAFAFPGDATRSAQPAVVGGRIFIGSTSGSVYSLDAATGCVYWKYDAGATVRAAISIGKTGGKTIAYFGDARSQVHAVDAGTGELLWKVKVEEHPASRITGAPAFYNGRLYVPVSSVEERLPCRRPTVLQVPRQHGSA